MCSTSVCYDCVPDYHLGTEATNATVTENVVVTGSCNVLEYKTDTAPCVEIKKIGVEGMKNNEKQEASNLGHNSSKVREQISNLVENSSYEVRVNLSDQFRGVDVRNKVIGNLNKTIGDRGNFNRGNLTLRTTSIASNIADISEYTFTCRLSSQGVPKKMETLLKPLFPRPPSSWRDGAHTDEEPVASLLGPEAPQCVQGLGMSECHRKPRMSENGRDPGISSEDQSSLMSHCYTPVISSDHQGPLMSLCYAPVASFDDVSLRPPSLSPVVMSPSLLMPLPSVCIASSFEDLKDLVSDPSCIFTPSAGGLVSAPDHLSIPSAGGLVSTPDHLSTPSAGGLVSTPDHLSTPSAEGLVTAPSGLIAPPGGMVSSPDGQLLPSANLISSPDGHRTPPVVSVLATDGHLQPAPAPPGGLVSTHPAGRATTPAAGKKIGRVLEFAVLLLTLILTTPVAARYDRGGPQHSITWGRGNSHNSAVFGNLPTNVTAVLGHRARLPCQVKNLGLKDVSWIRKRDLHILTVGIFTYTTDDRFKVFHPLDAEDWFLEISSVTFRDAGVYECQVSTSPKVSLPIHLTVLAVQQAEILGPSEVYIQHGSTISLHCEVEAGVEAVGPVHWYRGASTLNYSSPRGGISMEVEKTPTKTMSKLYITRAVRPDSGNYTCAPQFALPDSVIVHVVNAGEESAAAVQSGMEAARACVGVVWACVGVVWAATLMAAWLIPPPPTCRP